MSNEIGNNKEIVIKELKEKLVNLEIPTLEDKSSNTKSIFHAYNTNKESDTNQVERLEQAELEKLANDIKSFDGKAGKKDGTIDINEAQMFVEDFNKKHPDTKIETGDLFKFIKKMYHRYDYYNSDNTPKYTQNMSIGKPLSEKNITMRVYDKNSGKYQDVVLSIKLYATDNKAYPHQYIFQTTQGKEFCDDIAAEYGYNGKDAFNVFMQQSLKNPDGHSYEFGFQPEYSSTNKILENNKNLSLQNTENTTESSSVKESDVIVVPHGFNKDPRIIYAQYQDPKVIETMDNFRVYLEQSIEESENALNEYVKTYGWTEKTADLIAHIWNNDKIQTTGNTEDNIRDLISRAKVILESMKTPDNSLEGILQHKDFGGYFKQLTGTNFEPTNVNNFLKSRKDYIEKGAAIKTYNFVHKDLDNAISEFARAHKEYEVLMDPSYRAMASLHHEPATDMYIGLKYSKAYENLFDMFNALFGTSREKWDEMFKDAKKQNINPIECIQQLMKNLKIIVDQKTKESLGSSNFKNIDNYEKTLRADYNFNSSMALGKDGNLMKRVENYHNSQVTGGIVVSVVAQMALYATGLSALKGISMLSSGTTSGMAYAGSYLAVEGSNRLTNDIDNKEDLWNASALTELAGNASIEFAAGYLFDGILKSKIFGKYEDQSIAYNNKSAEQVGEAVLKNPNKKFAKQELFKILGVRGVAAGIGSTKDGLKEMFKESLQGQYDLSNIASAFVIGAISNALFIHFKKSDFAAKDHKITGKFIEKSPKTTAKEEMKNSYTEEELSLKSFIKDIKNETINYMKANAKQQNVDENEINQFLQNNPNALDDMIRACYIIEYMLPES